VSKTHIAVVLDRSGSMDSCMTATVDGFDEFVNKQKLAEGEATITVAQFDDEYEILYDFKDVQDVISIKDIYQPRGCTALLDAIGRTIKATKAALVMKSKSQQPDRVLCVIITDGYENASREYTRDQIVKLVREQEEGNWEYMFLGANMDAIAAATSFGLKASNAASYHTSNTDKAWDVLASGAACYRSMCSGQLESVKTGALSMISEEDREALVQ